MSEGVNDTTSSLVDSSTATTATETTATATTFVTETALESTLEPPEPPPLPPSPPPPSLSSIPPRKAKKTDAVKNYRKFRTNNITYYLIDGKKIRSALTHRKWPPRNRRVSFPGNDNDLVTGYLEPANPWEHADNVNTDDLISSYKVSCQRHDVEPMENLIAQLEKLDISDDERCPELSLKNECLDAPHCEPLEELLKRVQFEKIDVESSSLDDESATILFDMLEYYQSARHLNMSGNRNIGSRGWQACAQMIKRTTCLEQFEARDITLTQQHINILKRPIQLVSHLHVLKLENCGLAGRAFVVLVQALKMNTGLKELYLADNGFEQEDAIQLGALLRVNNQMQLLDISNNHIADAGARDLLDGLVAQSSGHRNNDKGLSILVLWNNDLTRSSSTYFSEAIAQSTTLETLNIGKNAIGNEFLELAQDTLTNSRTLLQLGMQSTNITCKGALLLAGIMERNRSLQRIDLRDNNIQMEGLAALSFAIKRNPCVTQLDLDPTPWSSKPATMNQYLDLVAEIRSNCARNEEPGSTDESTEESGSPQHRSRLSSVSSRKISLTCQTLPRSPSSLSQNSYNDITTRTMLEPKRTSGGRLRSPAPSPIPSPVASPIPSPSRGRFVVSRVCETSLSSTNSSASSSPATPSSLGSSSPTCFFPPASVVSSPSSSSSSSRFRVTVVGPPETTDPKKFVVTPANTNITIGFDYKIQRPDNSLDSDDSDSVFRSDAEDDNREEAIGAIDSSPSIDISMEDEFKATCVEETHGEWPITNETKVSLVESEDSRIDDPARNDDVPAETENNQTRAGDEEIRSDSREKSACNDLEEISSNSATLTGTNDNSSLESFRTSLIAKNEESSRDEIITGYEEETKKPEVAPPRQTTSLKRLLGLFQHPGGLFSPSSYVEKTEANNTLQNRVNSMIALGDKFQQYLRDGRTSTRSTSEDSTGHPILQRSVSDASRSVVKIDPVKSPSVQQLSSIETSCVGDYDSMVKVTREWNESTDGKRVVLEANRDENRLAGKDERVSRINEDLTLPEYAQTAETSDSLSSIDANDRSSIPVDRRDENSEKKDEISGCLDGNERKTSVSPKLKDIQEYSILETKEAPEINADDRSSSMNHRTIEDDEKAREIRICDSSSGTTDSIIRLNCKISSQCKVVKCDNITSGDTTSVNTLSSDGDVHNFFTKNNEDEKNASEHRDAEIIANSEIIEDEKSSRRTSDGKLEEISAEEKSSNLREDSITVDIEKRDISEEKCARDAPRNYCGNEGKNADVREERVLGDDEQPETIEEFLPLELINSTIVSFDANDSSKNYSYDLDKTEVDEFGENGETIAKSDETGEEGEAKIKRLDVDLSDERVNEFFVRESSSAVLKNEFSIARTVANSIDEENYVAGIIEQFSSSLSDDSGYSGKLSMDETRNCDLSLNDLTEITVGNETIDRIVAEASIIDSRSQPTIVENDVLSRMEESVAFVRANVQSSLETFLSGDSLEARLDSGEAMSSESSEDLIFKITDIDVSTGSKEATKAVSTKIQGREGDSIGVIDRYYETGQASSGGLFIEISRNAHRNSQDSGIEEITASISEENCLEASHRASDNFQESLDSGIDSECSSVSARVDTPLDSSKLAIKQPEKFDNSIVIVDRETSRCKASRTDIDNVLGTKDINVYNDPSRIARIDVEANIEDVVGPLGDGT